MKINDKEIALVVVYEPAIVSQDEIKELVEQLGACTLPDGVEFVKLLELSETK